MQWLQRDSGNIDCRGTVRIEEQWLHRNSQYRGTMGTEEQRNSGTVSEEQC